MHFRSLRPWRALFVGSAVAVAVAAACAPDITFVKPPAAHCDNGVLDTDSGESDIDCGGADCPKCSLSQACIVQADCADGGCLGGFCQQPGCDNQIEDSDETGVDCGGSCKPCGDGEPCGEPKDCTSKSCQASVCAPSTCSDDILNGDETARDCGGSSCDGCPVGSPCNVDTDCITGACDPSTLKCVLSCPKGHDDCDGDLTTCETNLLTSSTNCGTCGHKCDLPHAGSSCIGGSCQIDGCAAPWDRCDTDETNGCETNLSTDAKNCGACGMECPGINGTATCVGGKCKIGCAAGFDDCDGDSSNGCETSVKSDVDNCGGCKMKCEEQAGQTPYCGKDGCGLSTCEDGTGNCEGDPSGKCNDDLQTDVSNCGRCGHLCSVANGTADCVAGECVVASCDKHFDNCNTGDADGGYKDGCEANLDDSADDCGKCGNKCAVDNGSGTCQSGVCAVVSCDGGFKNCDADAADEGIKNGCETNTSSDAANCGGCGNACALTNAVMKCVASECTIDGCADGFGDCTAADGCETDISTNIQHCGGCSGPGTTCSKAGATDALCAGGACQPPPCDATHLNCDGDNSNGCEATLGTAATCSACPADGGSCGSSTPNCVASGSTFHCQASIGVGASAVGAAQTATLSGVTHSLQLGTNRLVLVGVVSRSDNEGTGVVQARPDTVTYGGIPMTKFDELGGPINDSANLYLYYLTDTGTNKLPTAMGNQAVTVDASKHSPQAKMVVANVVQFTGVDQTTPLVTGAKTTGTTSKTLSSSVTVATNGSLIYALVGAQYVSGFTQPVDTDLAAPLLMNQNIASNTLISLAGVTAARAPGAVTIGWTWNYAPTMSVQYAVLIQPAQN